MDSLFDDFANFGAATGKNVTCFCAPLCSNGESRGTCETQPGGKCFTATEKIIENGNEKLIVEYGCLPPDVMSLLQCNILAKVHNNTGKGVECCNTHDYCNNFLLPSTPNTQSTDGSSNINFHIFLASTVISLIGFIIIMAYYFRKKIRRAEVDELENGKPELENTTGSESIVVSFSVENSWRTRTIIHDIEFGTQIAKGKFTEIWRGSWRGDPVAIKIYNKDEEKEWKNEVDIFQTPLLKHDSILAYIASTISDDKKMHIITAYHSAGSLRCFLNTNSVTQSELIKMITGLASALSFLHIEMLALKSKPRIAHNNINSTSILVMENKRCCFSDLSQAKKFSVSEDDSIEHMNSDIRYLSPEHLKKSFDPLTDESFMKADIYSFSLIIWEIMNRCKDPPGIVHRTYTIPYDDKLKSDNLELSLSSMREIVVSRNIRPHVNIEWNQNVILKELVKIMLECWNPDPSVRLTTLRLKKNILKIQSQDIIMEE